MRVYQIYFLLDTDNKLKPVQLCDSLGTKKVIPF